MNKRFVFLFFLVYIFLFVLVQLPIWINNPLPLQDYPNHLARMHIILNLKDNPFLKEYYQINFVIIPNLAMDITVPFLAKTFGLKVAGKMIIVLTFLVITSGSIFLNYALFKKINFWPMTTFILLYNFALIKGFINFLFSIGLALWGIGLWILMRKQKLWLRWLLFPVLSSILFICHLYGLCFYGIVIIFYEFGQFFIKTNNFRKIPLQELALTLGQFVIPIILYFSSHISEENFSLKRFSILKKLSFEYLRNLSDTYTFSADLVTVAFVLLIPLFGIYTKKLSLHKSMILPIAALTVTYFCLPPNLATGANTDWRLLIPLFLLILSSMKLNIHRITNIVVVVLVISILTFRMLLITLEWNSIQSEYKEIFSSFERIEEGSRLFTARAYSRYKETLPFIHASTYAIIEKSAFVPSLFTYETQQPVQFNPEYREIAQLTSQSVYRNGRGIDWKNVLKYYNYVLLVRENLFKEGIPKSQMYQVLKGKYVTLYKVDSENKKVSEMSVSELDN